MSRIAGIVAHPVTTYADLNRLKQSLLLCDLVGFFALDSQIASLRKHSFRYPVMGHIANELEYLLNAGYLIEALKRGERFSFSANSPVAAEFLREGEIINRVTSKMKDKRYNVLRAEKDADVMWEAEARLACLKLNHEENDFSAVPLIKQLRLPKESNTTKKDVVNMIINNMPIPDEQVPWESILEFKANPDNKGRLSMLKDWMNKTVSSDRPASEVADELESLLYLYTKSLDIHKIKHKTGFLQTFVLGGAELIENLLKLNLSSVAKTLLSARVSQAELYSAELSSPGNALAYIYQAGQKFNK